LTIQENITLFTSITSPDLLNVFLSIIDRISISLLNNSTWPVHHWWIVSQVFLDAVVLFICVSFWSFSPLWKTQKQRPRMMEMGRALLSRAILNILEVFILSCAKWTNNYIYVHFICLMVNLRFHMRSYIISAK
jgi:hypothetical protein